MSSSENESTTQAALNAFKLGYCPIPIVDGTKRPYGTGWQRTVYRDEREVRARFEEASAANASSIGVLLGAPSSGLIDVDLDHPLAWRLRADLLPPTHAKSGRAGSPYSHYWFQATGPLPETRQYKLPSGEVLIELRSTGAQTLIPPSIHPTGEIYEWHDGEWGGEHQPMPDFGPRLARRVALIALVATLADNWPTKGSRHEAYLALAGGLLRFGDVVHPFWGRNNHTELLISSLSYLTHDLDGADARIAEVIPSTIAKLRAGQKVRGWPSLAEIIGVEHVKRARSISQDIEMMEGLHRGQPAPTPAESSFEPDPTTPDIHTPLEARATSWSAVDLHPYLSGQIVMPEPAVLTRSDGAGLFYPGRVNSLFGKSESAKSWVALWACVQQIAEGQRVVYVDLEDNPEGTVERLQAIGVGNEDVERQFRYVNPDGPLESMQRYPRYGDRPTKAGVLNDEAFTELLSTFDPTLIVIDGMTVLYGLHGHDTNESSATEVITGWLKKLCRDGRTTVIIIDHTGKGGSKSPIGSQHKIAMVQGTALRVDVLDQPMPGAVGRVELVVFKDRPGLVRKVSTTKGNEQVAALVTLDSVTNGVTVMYVEPAQEALRSDDTPANQAKLDKINKDEELCQQILHAFGGEIGKQLSREELYLACPGVNKHNIKRLEDMLIVRGEVRIENAGNKRRVAFDPRP